MDQDQPDHQPQPCLLRWDSLALLKKPPSTYIKKSSRSIGHQNQIIFAVLQPPWPRMRTGAMSQTLNKFRTAFPVGITSLASQDSPHRRGLSTTRMSITEKQVIGRLTPLVLMGHHLGRLCAPR